MPLKLAIAGVLALGLALVGTWAHARLKSAYVALVVGLLDDTLEAQVQRIHARFAARLAEVQRSADDPENQANLKRIMEIARTAKDFPAAVWGSREHEALLARLKPSVAALGGFLAIVQAPSFQVVASTDRRALGLVTSRGPSYAFTTPLALMGRRVVGLPRVLAEAVDKPVVKTGELPEIVMYFTAPLRAPEEPQAFAALSYGFDALAEMGAVLATERGLDSVETYAFNVEGTLMSPSRFEEQLVAAGLAWEGLSATTRLALRDPGGDLTAGFKPESMERRPLTAAVATALAGRGDDRVRKGTLMEPYRDYRGVEVFGAWRWLPEHKLGLVTEIDAAEALAPLKYVRMAGLFTYGLLLVAAAALIFASFGHRRKQREGLTRIGPYRLMEREGETGGAERYRGLHESLGQVVTLLLMRAERTSAEARDHFLEGARAAAKLGHPCTATVLDFGRAPDGTCYWASERLAGGNLAALVDAGEIGDRRRALAVLSQVAQSLVEAHAYGVVHGGLEAKVVVVGRRGGAQDAVQVTGYGLNAGEAGLAGDVAALQSLARVMLGKIPSALAEARSAAAAVAALETVT